MKSRILPYGLLAAGLSVSHFAAGDEPASGADSETFQCSDAERKELGVEMPVTRQLRRLSIDLRGVTPTMEEYAELGDAEDVPASLVDAFIASDEFREQMRRYHEDLLWTNPNLTLPDPGYALGSTTVGSSKLYNVTSGGKRKVFRGGDGTYACQDKPQSDLGYDAAGVPISEPTGSDAVGPIFQEGYVEILPYWESDPAKTLKVCAFDAQERAQSFPDANGVSVSCDSMAGNGRKECGCGPDLSYCIVGSVATQVLQGFREQFLRSVDDHTVGGEAYSELLTSKRKWTNGPLSHYLKYLAHRQTFARTQNWIPPEDTSNPDVPFLENETWVSTERPEAHAGILTLPAYLLRFQTNRGRANRFRIAFLDQFYEPPSTLDDACAPEGEDLTLRCVCRGCHVSLEPLASYFGQFAEAGSVALSTLPSSFDSLQECIAASAPLGTAYCERFYEPVPDLMDPDIRPYKLKALRFADDEHPEVQENFDAGPIGWANHIIASGEFHQVAVRHLFTFFMKRDPDLDKLSPTFEGEELELIAEHFREHDDIKLAVREILALPAYRRAQ